jgi:hypothetical protein
MRNKLLLFFALIATFVCLFAITSSATPVDGIYYTFTKTDTYENYAGTATVNTHNRTKGTLTNVVIPEYVEYDKDGDEDEVITFYVTDDRNHLPVRLDLYLNFGSAKAFLKTVKGNRYPLESIIE